MKEKCIDFEHEVIRKISHWRNVYLIIYYDSFKTANVQAKCKFKEELYINSVKVVHI